MVPAPPAGTVIVPALVHGRLTPNVGVFVRVSGIPAPVKDSPAPNAA